MTFKPARHTLAVQRIRIPTVTQKPDSTLLISEITAPESIISTILPTMPRISRNSIAIPDFGCRILSSTFLFIGLVPSFSSIILPPL